jgi:hypothetical protein
MSSGPKPSDPAGMTNRPLDSDEEAGGSSIETIFTERAPAKQRCGLLCSKEVVVLLGEHRQRGKAG